MKIKKESFRQGLLKVKETSLKSKDKVFSGAKSLKDNALNVMAPFLAVPELLKWSETITKSTATIYDKALDKEYLSTHIGGGNHRLFDGGHDLSSAINRVREASPDDTFKDEVLGYWKKRSIYPVCAGIN